MYGKQPAELKLNNLTCGFGIHFKKAGFDFGYTFGNLELRSRGDTEYFSIFYKSTYLFI